MKGSIDKLQTGYCLKKRRFCSYCYNDLQNCELDRCIDEIVNDLTPSPTLYTGIQQNKEILPNILVINGERYIKEVKK